MLKFVQSDERRSPLFVADDDGMLRVAVPPRETGEAVQLMSEPEEPVANEMEEFWSWLFPMVDVETNDVPLKERSWPEVYEVAFVPPLPMLSALARLSVPIVEVEA